MNWIRVDERLPAGRGDIVMTKASDGQILKSYYWEDCMARVAFYCKVKLSHFQDMQGNFLQNVTHWMSIPDFRKHEEDQ